MVLDEKDRDKASKILTVLSKLYGDQVPVAVLRSQFLSCRQKAKKSVRAFALRLRELHRKLHTRNATEAPTDQQLQD